MKKTVSTILVCVLLACTLLTLASCGNMLSGAYKAEVDLLIGKSSVTYEFGLFGKVTCTTNSLGKETVEEGKYELNDAGDKITLTFENEDGVAESETFDFVNGEENGVKYVKIGLVKYTKVD
ncbi:MAG: hypothetical protein IJX58_02275 [Clostridia bacterium]|nr:hypothetical protein [Clostridia bacterium]